MLFYGKTFTALESLVEMRTILQDEVIDKIMERENKNSKQFLSLLIVFQVTFILLFGFFVRYDENWTDEGLTRNTFKNCGFWESDGPI